MIKIILLFMLIINISLIFNSSIYGQKIEMQPKKLPVEPKPQTSQPTPSMELPDLTVSNIELNEECKIWFKVKNLGKGKIDENVYRNSIVKVIFGQNSKEFTLNQIDPQKGLNSVFGSVNFITDIKIIPPINFDIGTHSAIKVSVEVDSNKAIQEKNEQNNLLTKNFSNEFRLNKNIFNRKWKLGELLKFEWDLTYPYICASKPIYFEIPGITLDWSQPFISGALRSDSHRREAVWQIHDYVIPGIYCLKIGSEMHKLIDYGCNLKIVGGIKILSPLENDAWRKGEKRQIKWEWVGMQNHDLEIYLINQQNNLKKQVGNTKVKSGFYEWIIPGDISAGTYKLVLQLLTNPNHAKTQIQILEPEVDLEVHIVYTLVKRNPDRYKLEVKCRNKGKNTLDYVPLEWVITTLTGSFVDQGSVGFSRMYPGVIYTYTYPKELVSGRRIEVWIDRQNIHGEPEPLRNDNYAKEEIR